MLLDDILFEENHTVQFELSTIPRGNKFFFSPQFTTSFFDPFQL